ncbi:serine/threonine-protein kinase M1, partial [Linderina macrospora]
MSLTDKFFGLHGYVGLGIIVPIQSNLVPAFPGASCYGAEHELALSSMQKNAVVAAGSDAQTTAQRAKLHQPCSSDLPTISGFADEVKIMGSKQRPKKIKILGSDGRWYRFLCKSKDDLRKDARVM